MKRSGRSHRHETSLFWSLLLLLRVISRQVADGFLLQKHPSRWTHSIAPSIHCGQAMRTSSLNDAVSMQENQPQLQRILLVDDEPAILDAVSKLLLDTGKYQVTTCEDGATALQWALTEPRPQLIVSDVRMPDSTMDGLDLLRAIRSSPTIQYLPVVLLTAKGTANDRVAGYTAGADAYLPKPFDPAELMAIIENVLQRNPPEDNVATIRDLQRDLDDIKSRLLVKSGKAEKPVFLAPDERGILELVCEGMTNKEIAKRTYKTSRRVEQVLTILFRKAGVKNRTELVRWAVANRQVKL